MHLQSGLIGTRTLKNFVSQASSKAQEYQKRFAELKLAFINHGVVATEIVVVRTLSDVSNIGKFCCLFDLKLDLNSEQPPILILVICTTPKVQVTI
jgi:hypothetical protein